MIMKKVSLITLVLTVAAITQSFGASLVLEKKYMDEIKQSYDSKVLGITNDKKPMIVILSDKFNVFLDNAIPKTPTNTKILDVKLINIREKTFSRDTQKMRILLTNTNQYLACDNDGLIYLTKTPDDNTAWVEYDPDANNTGMAYGPSYAKSYSFSPKKGVSYNLLKQLEAGKVK